MGEEEQKGTVTATESRRLFASGFGRPWTRVGVPLRVGRDAKCPKPVLGGIEIENGSGRMLHRPDSASLSSAPHGRKKTTGKLLQQPGYTESTICP
jgi:hypothetical protein